MSIFKRLLQRYDPASKMYEASFKRFYYGLIQTGSFIVYQVERLRYPGLDGAKLVNNTLEILA
ncbi:hypothetical protein NIES2101_23490 [Calothrix sp. HK-06]|nr:hypothetical protein NIES2101_23490 [Calothrix sp. HK-06]